MFPIYLEDSEEFCDYTELGSGQYNDAYLSPGKDQVLKIQKNPAHSDTPERSVRLWNSINPDLHPKAIEIQINSERTGWVCPFIKGVQASDKEIASALLDIYNRTGRVIADAAGPNNFLKRDGDNKVICIDVGMAVQMEIREEANSSSSPLKRSNSIVSQDLIEGFWPVTDGVEAEDEESINSWLDGQRGEHPQTIDTIKALFFIKKNQGPDMMDVSCLQDNPQLVTQLANALSSKDQAIKNNAMELFVKTALEYSSTDHQPFSLTP
jgi:hypothetical protein